MAPSSATCLERACKCNASPHRHVRRDWRRHFDPGRTASPVAEIPTTVAEATEGEGEEGGREGVGVGGEVRTPLDGIKGSEWERITSAISIIPWIDRCKV